MLNKKRLISFIFHIACHNVYFNCKISVKNKPSQFELFQRLTTIQIINVHLFKK